MKGEDVNSTRLLLSLQLITVTIETAIKKFGVVESFRLLPSFLQRNVSVQQPENNQLEISGVLLK